MTFDPPHVVVMGVAGAGKTEVGTRLAAALSLPYADGDSFHSPSSIAKMSGGEPLGDGDRAPWLAAVGAWLGGQDAGAVVSCSALRRRYRDALREAVPGALFVHLVAEPGVTRTRLATRDGHFMPASLVESQFSELEPLGADEFGRVIDASQPLEDVIGEALALVADAAAPDLSGSSR